MTCTPGGKWDVIKDLHRRTISNSKGEKQHKCPGMTDKLDKQWKILQKNEDPFYVCTWKGLQNILSEKIKVQNTGVLCCHLVTGEGGISSILIIAYICIKRDRRCDRASELPREPFLAILTSNSINLAFIGGRDVENAPTFLAQSWIAQLFRPWAPNGLATSERL